MTGKCLNCGRIAPIKTRGLCQRLQCGRNPSVREKFPQVRAIRNWSSLEIAKLHQWRDMMGVRLDRIARILHRTIMSVYKMYGRIKRGEVAVPSVPANLCNFPIRLCGI